MAIGTSVTATRNKYLDGILSGLAWSGPLNFGFPDSAAGYGNGYGNGEAASGFAALTLATQQAARAALLGTTTAGGGNAILRGMGVADFTLLDITEGGAGAGADIRLAQSSRPPTAWAYMPGAGTGGDIWFGTAYAGTSNDYRNPVLGNYAYVTVLHELGHALGLKHAQEAGGVAGTAVPADRDSLEFTVMTHRSVIGGATTGYTFEQWGAPQTYMMLDIAALQAMYGADFTTRAGDTIYRWSATTGEMSINGAGAGTPGGNRIFLTVWDGNGHDTYDLSNYAGGVNVDLAPGGWSVLSAAQLSHLKGSILARGNVFNAMQYQGDARSLIEDAIGGAGNDTLRGNAADNRLTGGAGNDSLWGGAGADTLDGGSGTDTLMGGEGSDTYLVASATDLIFELAGQGTDTIVTGLSWTLGANLETLVLTGSGNVAGTGNVLNNTILGNAGDNLLSGGAGNDSLAGGAGRDTLDGGAGSNTLPGGTGDDTYLVSSATDLILEEAGAGLDRVVTALAFTLPANVERLELTGTAAVAGTGNALANVILGNAAANRLLGLDGDDSLSGGGGNDTLDGGTGSNTLEGGAGNDTYVVTSAADMLIEAPGAGIDLVIAGVAWTLGANLENLTLTGSGNLAGTGNALANVITGNAGANLLAGGDGADALLGGGGADTLWGGAGVDTLTGGDGPDAYRFLSANDGLDLVLGFLGVADHLEFSVAGFGGGLSLGMDLVAAGRLQINSAGTAVGSLAQFIYRAGDATLWWDTNGAGTGGATELAVLRGALGVTAADFLLIA